MASRFPDPRSSRSDVIALGDDLSPELLLDAYEHGIFPWPTEGIPLPWFSPRRRAILDFDNLHLSRSLERTVKRAPFDFTIDKDFGAVIRACAAAPRSGQDGTWIYPEIIEAYTELHRLNRAHSVEAWEMGVLVGGVYGVDAGGVFVGESMFHTRSSASLLALVHLIEHLRVRGSDWIDIQVLTPHMKALGARLVPRSRFLDRLHATQTASLRIF